MVEHFSNKLETMFLQRSLYSVEGLPNVGGVWVQTVLANGTCQVQDPLHPQKGLPGAVVPPFSQEVIYCRQFMKITYSCKI